MAKPTGGNKSKRNVLPVSAVDVAACSPSNQLGQFLTPRIISKIIECANQRQNPVEAGGKSPPCDNGEK